jgi:hypothetical protein
VERFSSYFTGAAAALALKVTALRISEAAARSANFPISYIIYNLLVKN